MITKMRRNFTIFVLTVFFATSSGCDVRSNPKEITKVAVASQTMAPVKTDVVERKETPLLQKTATSTSEPSHGTQSSVATMTDSDREMLVQNFLETSEDCKLPCLWEIIPGVTSWMDLENRLRIQGVEIIVSTSLKNGGILHGPGDFNLQNKHIINSFSFVEHNDVITGILLISDGYANSEYFQKQWREYSPSQVISIYGKPSRVWLKTRAKTMGNRHGYDLWLVYDNYGFIIQYEGFLEENGRVLHVCPRFEDGMDIMWLRIYIRAPDELDLLEDMGGLVSPEPQAGKKSIEVATGLSVKDFYELFNQEQEPACFDTTSEIWK